MPGSQRGSLPLWFVGTFGTLAIWMLLAWRAFSTDFFHLYPSFGTLLASVGWFVLLAVLCVFYMAILLNVPDCVQPRGFDGAGV